MDGTKNLNLSAERINNIIGGECHRDLVFKRMKIKGNRSFSICRG